MQSPQVSSRAGKGGPKTLEGKMRSSRNAVKHGLSSSQPIVMDFETPEAWEAFRSSFVESLHPANPAERHLAEEIALTLWRQRRFPLYEAHMTNTRMQLAEINWEQQVRKLPPQATEEHFQQLLYCAYTQVFLPTAAEADHLRYEGHLGRQLTRLFKEICNLQKTRNCETNSALPQERQHLRLPSSGNALETPPTTRDLCAPSIVPLVGATPAAASNAPREGECPEPDRARQSLMEPASTSIVSDPRICETNSPPPTPPAPQPAIPNRIFDQMVALWTGQSYVEVPKCKANSQPLLSVTTSGPTIPINLSLVVPGHR